MSNLYSDLNTFTPTSRSQLVELEAIYQSINNILDVSVGEMFFDQLEFGSNLSEQLFELGDNKTKAQTIDSLIRAIENNEPRVTMDMGNTTIDFNPDAHKTQMRLVFTIAGFGNEIFQLTR